MRTKKVLLLGPAGVGKTSLASRLKFDRMLRDPESTIGVELYQFEVSSSGDPCQILLWDTDSELGISVLDHEFTKGSDAAFVIADATDPETISTADSMRRTFLNRNPEALAVLVINKIDDNRVSAEQIGAVSHSYPNAVLCSVKSDRGVRQLVARVLESS